MAEIVKLAEYRRKHVGASRPASPSLRPTALQPSTPHYFCLRCDTDHFKLFPAGTVHCAQCGALMRNLRVGDVEKADTSAK